MGRRCRFHIPRYSAAAGTSGGANPMVSFRMRFIDQEERKWAGLIKKLNLKVE